GKVFVGTSDGTFAAFPTACDDPCNPIWTATTGSSIDSSPAVANGVVYIGSDDNHLYAYPTECSTTCAPLWVRPFQAAAYASPAIADGVVYMAADRLYAFDLGDANAAGRHSRPDPSVLLPRHRGH